ncbi:hypothetical protein Tco_1450888 [Tanacetum coccineum]
METCDPVDTLMVEKSKLNEDPQGKVVDPTCYHGMIGTLIYLTSNRPDLVFVVCMCDRYQYSKDSCIALTAFADADHAGRQDTRKRTYLCTAIMKVPLLYAATTSNTPDPSILKSDITLSRSK